MKTDQNLKNKHLFEVYNETRTFFLDNSDKEKLDWFKFYYNKMYNSYFETLHKNSSILDLGCNRGYLLKTFETHGFNHLVGVDLSKKDLEIAQQLVPKGLFIEDDIFNFLQRSQEKFDVIILKAVIEHVEKSRVVELLELMAKNLKPDGFVLIDVYNADWLFSHHDRYMDFTHETGFTIESLRQVMLCAFDSITIHSKPSPIDFTAYNASKLSSLKESIKYKVIRIITKYIICSIEPEMKTIPFMDRLLIGIGKNKK